MKGLLIDCFETVATFERSCDSSPNGKTAVHSGNAGDIIYSLPTCKILGVGHLYLNICTDPGVGGRTLTEPTCRALVPLLLAQPYLEKVTIVKGYIGLEHVPEPTLGVDINLDRFRLIFLRNPRLHIAYMHSLAFGIQIDINEPWLQTSPEAQPQNKQSFHRIVANLTPRYRRYASAFYEQLLEGVPSDLLAWVGLPDDQACRQGLPGLALQYESFLELANLLKASDGFIGNPSLPYAIAEGLKINRLVEVPDNGNVYPLGKRGELLHQLGLEGSRRLLFDWIGAATAPASLLASKLAAACHERDRLKQDRDTLRQEYDVLREERDALKQKCLAAEMAASKQLKGLLKRQSLLVKQLAQLRKQRNMLRDAVEKWNGRSWFKRAFHKLRLKKQF